MVHVTCLTEWVPTGYVNKPLRHLPSVRPSAGQGDRGGSALLPFRHGSFPCLHSHLLDLLLKDRRPSGRFPDFEHFVQLWHHSLKCI